MDYPELNFLLGIILVITEGTSIGLTVLLSRARLPQFAWRTSLVYLGLSVIAGLYILSLFLQTMTTAFNLRMLVVILLAGVVVYAVTALLRGRTFSGLAYRVLFTLFLLSTFASFLLSYGLFRAMVPV
jgi:hypothetical protein